MNATEKLEMQVDESKDGSAIAQLPEGMSNPQADDDDDQDGGSDSSDRSEDLDDDRGEGSTTDDPEREAIRAARREERKLKKQLHLGILKPCACIVDSFINPCKLSA